MISEVARARIDLVREARRAAERLIAADEAVTRITGEGLAAVADAIDDLAVTTWRLRNAGPIQAPEAQRVYREAP